MLFLVRVPSVPGCKLDRNAHMPTKVFSLLVLPRLPDTFLCKIVILDLKVFVKTCAVSLFAGVDILLAQALDSPGVLIAVGTRCPPGLCLGLFHGL